MCIDWIKNAFFKEETKVALVGLQKSGKTTFLDTVLSGEQFKPEDMLPTIGWQMKTYTNGNGILKVWDIGGSPRFRKMWEGFCQRADCIVYMVDTADHEHMETAKDELQKLLGKPQLAGIPEFGFHSRLRNQLLLHFLQRKREHCNRPAMDNGEEP